MSQVVQAITSHDSGERRILQNTFTPLFQDVFSAKSEIQEGRPELATVYRIGVTIGSQVCVGELESATRDDALADAITRTKRQVIEAIFGEFRQDFMLVERALYDRDFNKAREHLRVFERKMFDVGC